MLRRSVRAEQLVSLFLCSPPVHARTIRDLADQVTRLTSAAKIFGLPVHDLGHRVQEVLEQALAAAPLAGPEEDFRKEVLAAAEGVLDSMQRDVHIDVEKVVQRYAKTESSLPTEKHPLPSEDRATLRTLYVHYRKLREHPLLPFKETKPLLAAAFEYLGWEPVRGLVEDLSPSDVLKMFRRVERQLRWLALKHIALSTTAPRWRTDCTEPPFYPADFCPPG